MQTEDAQAIRKMRERCTCQIGKKATNLELFCLHYGVHELGCPVYQLSRDPVDRKYDQIARHEILAR